MSTTFTLFMHKKIFYSVVKVENMRHLEFFITVHSIMLYNY